MLSENFRRWQEAENAATHAARQLQAALLKDNIPPDHVFERARQLRVEAGLALEALMAEYGRESARVSAAAAGVRPGARPATRSPA